MAARNPINLIFRGINIVILVFCALFINASLAEASPVLYYGQSYSPYEMRYVNLSQSDIMKTIYTSPNGTIKAVAIDLSNKNLYFSDPIEGIIYRSKLDGSSVTPYLTGVYAEGVAVDAVHNFFYYTQSHTDSNNVEHYNVVRANLDNPLAAPTELYTSATGTPEAITVAENGDLYFSDPHESVAKIYKVAVGASNPVEFMTGVHAYGLAVTGGYLYYTEAFEPDFKVRKVSLANIGSVTDLYIAPAGAPKAMTVFGNDLYFANQHSSVAQVCKINLDTGIQSSVLSNVNAGGIAILDNTPPAVTVNTGITTNENKSVVLNNSVLQVTDLEIDDPAGLIFKVGTVPGIGKLTKGGLDISAGDTFSQSDINSGLISYVPNPATDGPDSIILTASDGMGGSTAITVPVTINPANNAPTFTKGENQTVLEDAGAQTVAGWATAMSVGPADESSQTYEFSTNNNNNSLFTVQPQLSHDGTLTYTPAANAYGIATVDVTITDSGGTANDGIDRSTQTFTITVTGINDSPSFTKGPDQTVAEDAGAQTITGWATGISAGPNESSQTVSFTVTNNNNALFLAQPAISADGALSFTTANNLYGSATVTVTLHDNGGTANGGADVSSSQEFTITVTAVNDAPTFTRGADQTVLEDYGAQTAAGWATAMSVGPADESSQTYEFSISNNNNSLFTVQPQLSQDGTLTYTPAANAYGIATVDVTITDSGGTANGGADSSVQTFTITVTGINDSPSFTKGPDQTVSEDAGAQTITGWATGISAGPNESSQTLSFTVTNNNNALFSAAPAISADGALSFTAANNHYGSAAVTVTLHDNGGTANGGADVSSSQEFTITVTAVNDAPTFTRGADQTVLEDAGAQTVSGWATAMSVGPADESSQTYEFSISNNNNSLFTVQPQLSHDGTLTYTPDANTNGMAIVDVTITDNGGTANGGADSSTQTFTITVTGVNDSPSFTKGPDQTVPENAGATTITGWATGISAGPNESSQTVSFTVTNSNNALFSAAPAISADGELSFTVANNHYGSAAVTVTLHDNGGTDNGGADVSSSQEFTITVVSIGYPDAPTGVSAAAGDRQATIWFSAPASDGGSAITSYTVTSSPDGKTATGSGSPITISGLTNGTAYTFTVTASNNVKTSASSEPSNSVTPYYSVTGITISPTSGVYTVPIEVTINGSSLAVGESVYYSTIGDPQTTAGCPSSSTLPVTFSLSNTSTVYARVYSGSGFWGGLVSATYTFRTNAPVIASPVYTGATEVSGTSTANAGITLYKNAVPVGSTTANPSGNWTVSGLSALNTGDILTATAIATGKELSNLSAAVTVISAGGSSHSSHSDINFTAATNAAISISESSATLQGKISSDVNASITDYGFLYGSDQSNLNSHASAGNNNYRGDYSYELTGLSPGTTYYFRAYSLNNNGQIVYGDILSFTTEDTAKPNPPNPEEIQMFSDVPATYWAYANINNLYRKGCLSGYNGNFRPDADITRAEFITMLVKALNLTAGNNSQSFDDINSHWAKDNIYIAAALDITVGYSGNKFKPDDPITREEMAVMAVKAAKLAESSGETAFNDNNQISSWAKGSVLTAVNNGIIKGYPNNTFCPRNSATRAEAVSIIINII